MFPELTAEQEMFRDVTRRYLESLDSIGTLRLSDGEPAALNRSAWAKACELGWLGAITPTSQGGFAEGGGAVELSLLGTERGRTISAAPLLGATTATAALLATDNAALADAWMAPIADGQAIVSWLGPRRGQQWVATDGFTARSVDGGYTINGVCTAAEWATDADLVLVAATDDRGETMHVLIDAQRAGIAVTRCAALDLSLTFGRVVFSDVSVAEDDVVSSGLPATALDDRMAALALLLQCAELVGALDVAIESAIDYAQNRYAFGRPIGSFQAIKHMIADAAVAREASRAALAIAVRGVDDVATDADEGAAALRTSRVAKIYIGDAAVDVIERALQVFGGIGFTWDHHIHFYLRKAASDRERLGTPDFHRGHLFTHLATR